MADTKQRRCPLRWLICNGNSEDYTSPCIREECQWWIPSGSGGACAVEFIGIGIADQAGYVITAAAEEVTP